MKHRDGHLPVSELLMAADGELPAARKAEVAAHLDACWSCRETMRSLESTIGEFVRVRREELDREVADAAGPAALLRARLAEESNLELTKPRWPRMFRRIVPVAAGFFCIVAVVALMFQTRVSAEGPRPRAVLTPGETRPISLGEVCRTEDAEVVSANIPEELRRRVLSEYGIRGRANNFEVDYLITPDLGGADSIRNLWPQPYSTRWNAHVKDSLEQRLHQLVCQGKLDLPTAQRALAADWIGAYKKYFHTDKPISGESSR